MKQNWVTNTNVNSRVALLAASPWNGDSIPRGKLHPDDGDDDKEHLVRGELVMECASERNMQISRLKLHDNHADAVECEINSRSGRSLAERKTTETELSNRELEKVMPKVGLLTSGSAPRDIWSAFQSASV